MQTCSRYPTTSIHGHISQTARVFDQKTVLFLTGIYFVIQSVSQFTFIRQKHVKSSHISSFLFWWLLNTKLAVNDNVYINYFVLGKWSHWPTYLCRKDLIRVKHFPENPILSPNTGPVACKLKLCRLRSVRIIDLVSCVIGWFVLCHLFSALHSAHCWFCNVYIYFTYLTPLYKIPPVVCKTPKGLYYTYPSHACPWRFKHRLCR